MSMVIRTRCSRCGKEYTQSVRNGDTVKYPDGWKHYDFNDLGPNTANIFDLCPFCYSILRKEEEQRLRDFVKENL